MLNLTIVRDSKRDEMARSPSPKIEDYYEGDLTGSQCFLNVKHVMDLGVVWTKQRDTCGHVGTVARVNVYYSAKLKTWCCPDSANIKFCKFVHQQFEAGHYDDCVVYELTCDDYDKCRQ